MRDLFVTGLIFLGFSLEALAIQSPHTVRPVVKIFESEAIENINKSLAEKTRYSSPVQTTSDTWEPAVVLHSKFVKDSFNIFVKLPKEYQPGGKIRYPVVYLLDANAYMQEVADSMIVKNTQAILVGVGYNNMEAMDSLRDRDYTFPKALASDSFAVSGGAPKFLSFLQKELQPYIHQNYSVDTTNETLMGHSLGGYFTLYALTQALLQKQVTFQHFVAASPSLGYSHQYIIKQFRKILQDHSASPKTLRITLGAQEDVEDDTGTESSDQFNKLVQILKRPAFKNLNLSAEIYPNLGHMETVVPTFTAAIKAIRPR